MNKGTKEISVFVDESGSFDPDRSSSRYYSICSEFNAYDKLKVYYDNGQSELTSLLKEAFAIYASRTEFVPAVEPSNYRLFQVADIACTLELARAKLSEPDGLSESEHVFFGGEKNFKKNYLKLLDRKLFK